MRASGACSGASASGTLVERRGWRSRCRSAACCSTCWSSTASRRGGCPSSNDAALLEGLVEPGPTWMVTPSQRGGGAALLELAREQGREGIMAKRLDAPVPAGATLGLVAQGEDPPRPGVRGVRMDPRRGAPLQRRRFAGARLPRRGRLALGRQRRHRADLGGLRPLARRARGRRGPGTSLRGVTCSQRSVADRSLGRAERRRAGRATRSGPATVGSVSRRCSAGDPTSTRRRCAARSDSDRRAVSGDDRSGVDSGRQRAEHRGASRCTVEPRGAERVGDGDGRVLQHQRALEQQRHRLDQAPCPVLDRVEVGQLPVEAVEGVVVAAVDTAGELELAAERVDATPVRGPSPAARRGR